MAEGRLVHLVLLALVLGWWLAVRTLALRIGEMVTEAAPTLPPSGEPERLALPAAKLRDRVEDYLTVKEIEKYLPLCGKSIRQEIKDGKLQSHRLRGKITVKSSDALAWLSARREG